MQWGSAPSKTILFEKAHYPPSDTISVGGNAPTEFHETKASNFLYLNNLHNGYNYLIFVVERPLEALELMMKINDDLLKEMVSDLSLNVPFVKGKNLPIRNCWHFCTDGNAVDRLFDDDRDFRDAMNRIFIVGKKYRVVILAFCLMDTHVHFILYGSFEECNRFIHKFIQLTSRHIRFRHMEHKKLWRLPVSHQFIDNDNYLKVAICYVIKNAPVGGLPFNALDYPWSGNPLYFRRMGYWNSPHHMSYGDMRQTDRKGNIYSMGSSGSIGSMGNTSSSGSIGNSGSMGIMGNSSNICSMGTMGSTSSDCSLKSLSKRKMFEMLRTKSEIGEDVVIVDGIVHPGEYVAWEIVEQLFKTHKSFNWFMCKSKEEDVEKRGGNVSRLSIPIQEMRQHRNEVCKEIFGIAGIRTLPVNDRIKLAKVLKSRYNSSSKQLARVCGLVYSEVKNLL